jgi:hypothetical protein
MAIPVRSIPVLESEVAERFERERKKQKKIAAQLIFLKISGFLTK